MKLETVLKAFSAVQAVHDLPPNSVVPHEVWRQCMRAMHAIENDLRVARVELPLEMDEVKEHA